MHIKNAYKNDVNDKYLKHSLWCEHNDIDPEDAWTLGREFPKANLLSWVQSFDFGL